jgi:hypothetical protein
LTVEGENIFRGARVIIGDTQSATVAFFPSTKIVVYSPPRQKGAVDITLVNPDGSSYTKKTGFRYLTKEEMEFEEKKNISLKVTSYDLEESNNKSIEKIKNLLRPYKPYIIKSIVYVAIFTFLFILLSMNRKNRLIKKIINQKKNISGNHKK